MKKTLEGDLAAFEIPDLLTFLNMGRRTGVLVMERPEQETKIFFREGEPIFSTSTKDELRAPSLLVRQGRIDAERAEWLRKYHPTGAEKVGEVLLSEKLLDESDLGPFLKVQISEVIFDTFSWHTGLFAFFDKVPPPQTAVTIEIDLQNLIMEGVRRLDEADRVAEVFADRSQVVEVVANPERVKNSVTLTGEEWRVFFLVDGRRNVDEIVSLARDGDETATLEVLRNLLVANLVALVPSRPAADERPRVMRTGTQKVATHMPTAEVKKKRESRPSAPADAAASEASETPSVQFSAPRPSVAPNDDARQIVSARAVGYMSNAERVANGRLVLLDEKAQQRTFALTRDSSTLGRHRNNDIVISDGKVSGFHARIDRAPAGFTVVDLESRNGTFVNNRRVKTQALASGDVIRVGAAKLRYEVDA